VRAGWIDVLSHWLFQGLAPLLWPLGPTQSWRGGLPAPSSPAGIEIEEGGFCRCSACQGVLPRAGRLGDLKSLDKWLFPPHYTHWCVLCVFLCVCTWSVCLLVGWISLFVILVRGWLSWLAGSWEGFSCWRFQIELVSGRAQLLRDCHIPY
jgi:hypothetical protein